MTPEVAWVTIALLIGWIIYARHKYEARIAHLEHVNQQLVMKLQGIIPMDRQID